LSYHKSTDTAPTEGVWQLTLTVGLWVLVKCDNEKVPGEVTCIDDNNIEVYVMIRSGRAWKWLTPEDKLFYTKEDVLHKNNPPSVAGNHGQFTFSATHSHLKTGQASIWT